jgi:ABC-type transport system involved in multi-copper enzyme maturation permease subunit
VNLGQWFAKLDRLQQTLIFKVVASILVIALAIGLVISARVRESNDSLGATRAKEFDPSLAAEQQPGEAKPSEEEQKARREQLDLYNSQARFFNRLVDEKYSTTAVAIGTGVACVPVLAAIWLGIGLTLAAYLALGAAVCWPLLRFGNEFWRSVGTYAAGVLVLALSFSTLVQALRLGFSASHPVTAIARNVLAEAVRMKVSLVFIVILILGLAALPGLLEPNTPLRYRVQSFMQYGATGSFWVTAILCLFLSAASVAFDQRDKTIWQTMTKPVRAWQYMLGKWLGVVGLAAVLLGVSCTGVFLFTEYLRRTQTAVDETAPYVSAKGPGTISEDRLVLETQVLVGRMRMRPLLPTDLAKQIDDTIQTRLREAARLYEQDRRANETPNEYKIRRQVESEMLGEFLSVPPGGSGTYEFIGLADAREFSVPLTLRYKVNSGANNPTDFFTVSFFIEDSPALIRTVPLGQVLTIPLSNASVRHRPEKTGDAADSVILHVINGDVGTQRANNGTISFAPDGLEISYAVSSFQANFLRVAIVMWLKLAFLAAIALTTATFLAFPVACLVSFGCFLLAEAAGFLATSLEYFSPDKDAGGFERFCMAVISAIASPLTSAFRFYSDLSPMADLVEGRIVSWGTVGNSVLVMGGLCLAMLVIASTIFKNRELATYSGQ